MRLRHDLLAASSEMAAGRRLVHATSDLAAQLDEAGKIDWGRAALDTSFARARGGAKGNGPNPSDRGRSGVKHHLLLDVNGIPLAGEVTGANLPDGFGMMPLIDSAGPLDPAGETEGPGRRPDALYADRSDDVEALREVLRERGIEPKLAKHRTAVAWACSDEWSSGQLAGRIISSVCEWSRKRHKKCNWRC